MRKFCCYNCRCCVGYGERPYKFCKLYGKYMTWAESKETVCKDFIFNPSFEYRLKVYDNGQLLIISSPEGD